MTSTDFHLRHVIRLAVEERSHQLVDDAFKIIEGNFDRFSGEFSPELLVEFAEVASDLRDREDAVIRALELFGRLRCEDDQFRVRALLVRCVYEARLGSDTLHLKGMHLLQQLKYALDFLTKALSIATRPGNDTRYGFLIYNASRVFWDVVCPICRIGWQKHIVQEANSLFEALKTVVKPGAAAGGKGGGGAATHAIPLTGNLVPWLTELALNVAFGLEDADKNADAQKVAEYAYTLAEETQDTKLKTLVLSARAHLARKAPGKTKDDIDKASASTVAGTVFFVCNGGIPKEQAEDQLVAVWKGVDPEYDLRAAKDAYMARENAIDAGKTTNRPSFQPKQLADLASILRAACRSQNFILGWAMLRRLDKCQVPAGRGRLLVDLSRAELELWEACNVKKEDPVSKLLLSPSAQMAREIEMRHRCVRLCEQCIATAKRIDEIDLVEDAAVVMWNIGRELACSEHRHRIHKSFLKCAEILEEVQSISLAQLRAHLHFEVACCEISQDLLTKGKKELNLAESIDYTVTEKELPDAIQKQIGNTDPGPYIRKLGAVVDSHLHLLHWKVNLYEEPSDLADQAMLLLDQVQRQPASAGKLVTNLLAQAFSKLEVAMEDLSGERLQGLKDEFESPPLVVFSCNAIKPLPHHAPATVMEGGTLASEIAATVPQPVKDQKPKSDREIGVEKAKRIIMLMCHIGLEAYRVGELEFALKACCKATSFDNVAFGPPPIEVEGAVLLAQAAYTRALCLASQVQVLGSIPGKDDDQDPVEEDNPNGNEDEDDDEDCHAVLTPEEKAASILKKKELISSLLYGMDKSLEFKQWWMVANGLSHWWNIHLDLVSASHTQPHILGRTLPEYQDGLKTMQKFLWGENAIPNNGLDHSVASNIALAYINTSFENNNLAALETDALMLLKRLGENERKDIIARVTHLCKTKDKVLPDLARLRPERLESAGGGGKDAKKGVPAAAVPEDRSDLQGNEADITAATVSIPYAKDSAEAIKLIDQSVALLSKWEPRGNDETMLTLWVELWTRLGRNCLGKPMQPNAGAKYALMCAIKGLGELDAPMPQFGSRERLRWRGACHALCGDVFVQLIDPHKQEKESLVKLRRMSVEQFERCCDCAISTSNNSLATFGAKNMWNVALPLMLSAETRQCLVQPLTKATRALAGIRYQGDPFFFAGLYKALFDCYSDAGEWDRIHEMLDEAFPAVPATCHRRLWALRMLALSRRGKNVVVAMGKMKESQARAQANIWLVLAGASAQQSDQLNAYSKAIEILQSAEQPEVVEVRMQFADWFLRNRFGPHDALEQLDCAADLLLDLEEGGSDEEENDETLDNWYRGEVELGQGSSMASDEKRSQSDVKSFTGSRASMKSGQAGRRQSNKSPRSSKRSSRSGAGSRRGRLSVAGSSPSRRSSRRSTVRPKTSKMSRHDEDVALSTKLHAHNYESLCRIFASQARLLTGTGMHEKLLSASHFAIRFFASSVELANDCARQLAVSQIEAATAAQELAGDGQRRPSRFGGDSGKSCKRRDEELDAAFLVPCFRTPTYLTDWIDESQWPWAVREPLQENSESVMGGLLQRAALENILQGDGCTWAGHTDAFSRPTLSFHVLNRLQEDLENHCYHLWTLPVGTLLVELSRSFQGPLNDAVACLAYLRLGRLGAECRLSGALVSHKKGLELLKTLPSTFRSFDDEREQARSQRAGRQNPDTLEPDWLPPPTRFAGPVSHMAVGAPWLCNDLCAYEVWAAIARECLLHGEVWSACTLVAEAIEHAKDHGNRRTMRHLLITKSQLASAEGRYDDVVSILQAVHAAEPDELVQISSLLAQAYRTRGRAHMADTVLRDAFVALRRCATPQNGICEALLRFEEIRGEMLRLRNSPSVSNEWLCDTRRVFAEQAEQEKCLHSAGYFRNRISANLEFVHAMAVGLETRYADLKRDPATTGILEYAHLKEFATQLCTCVAACRSSRDSLLAGAVPAEGVESSLVLPAEALSVSLDTCLARCNALRRVFASKATRDSNSAGTFQPRKGSKDRVVAFSNTEHVQCEDDLDEGAKLARQVDVWLDDTEAEVQQMLEQKTVARNINELETSAFLLSNASATFRCFPHAGLQTPSTHCLAPCFAEAFVEFGCAKFELARLRPRLPGGFEIPSVWTPVPTALPEPPVEETEENEDTPLESAELPPEADEAVAEATEPPVAEEVARNTLGSAWRAALHGCNFQVAKRGVKLLALEAYGVRCSASTFELLVWFQSIDICGRAEEILQELQPGGHNERVQMAALRDIERRWPCPDEISAYRAISCRLKAESPTFQRLNLTDLPAVDALLLSDFPSLTLVVTLQIHDSYLHVAAVRTPPEGETSVRSTQLKFSAFRLPLKENEVHDCSVKLQELANAIEKEIIISGQLDTNLMDEYVEVLSKAERAFAIPIAHELVSSYWEEGLEGEHADNPKQMLLMPDAHLWNFPFERFASFRKLFQSSGPSAMNRDFSLHLFAQRSRTPAATVRTASSVLLTDPFNEDRLFAQDDAKSENMGAMHRRLVESKIISNGEKSVHGEALTASSQDIMSMAADCTMFFSVGFGRFWSTFNSRDFITQDFRHLRLLGLFHRCQNDIGFRRQTKVESLKPLRQQAMENPFGTALIASLRGVQCVVLGTLPIPVSLNLKSFEVFAKGVQGGRSAAKSLEEVITQQGSPEFRYSRMLQGGVPPGGAAPADPKKGTPPPPEDAEDVLPPYAQMSFVTVGLAWAPAETAEAGGKKK